MPENTDHQTVDPIRRANVALIFLIICAGISIGMSPLVYVAIVNGDGPAWAQIVTYLIFLLPICGGVASGFILWSSIRDGHCPNLRH